MHSAFISFTVLFYVYEELVRRTVGEKTHILLLVSSCSLLCFFKSALSFCHMLSSPSATMLQHRQRP